jgi:hypothetical protein
MRVLQEFCVIVDHLNYVLQEFCLIMGHLNYVLQEFCLIMDHLNYVLQEFCLLTIDSFSVFHKSRLITSLHATHQ